MKDIDWRLSKKQNGKGSPNKVLEKYNTDNDIADERWKNKSKTKEAPLKKNTRDESTSPENKRRL